MMSNTGQTIISILVLLIAAGFILQGFATIANPSGFWQLLIGVILAYLGWHILRGTGVLDMDRGSPPKGYRVPIAL